MKILTFNLWHGLAPATAGSFVELEPEVRRLKREELQESIVAGLQADVVLFQEVNPLADRLKRWQSVLNMQGFAQPDLSGLKVKGWGWPPRLNSGLGIFVSKQFAPRWVAGLQLSGGRISFAKVWATLQLSESRYALFIEFLHPQWGRVLVVNCHLHHGLELDESLRGKISKLGEENILTANATSELKDRISGANGRRLQEVRNLLEFIHTRKQRYSLILLGGDLNCSSTSPAMQQISEFGFRDLWLDKHRTEASGYTFDHSRNHANHVLTSQYPLTIETEDLSFSPKTRDVVRGLLQDHERRERRIDYLLAWSSQKSVPVKNIELVGVPDKDHLGPSDHFGVLAEIEEPR